MKWLQNSRGVTLVELLAALAIIGFISVLIWRFFFQTIDYNSYAVTEQTLQQEANVILATLQSQHTQYTIESLYTDFTAQGQSILKADLKEGPSGNPETVVIAQRPNIEYVLLSNPPADQQNPISASTISTVQSTGSTTSNRMEMEVNLVLTSNYKQDRPLYFVLSTKLSKLTTN